ncbi:MAG: DUF1566 domain-containing protein [Elusimicrobiales bacterium]|jgi:hypothetical protein
MKKMIMATFIMASIGVAYAGNFESELIGGDAVTIDYSTKLMWAQDGIAAGCNNGYTATWHDADAYCKNLTFAGHTDWRLPAANELLSIASTPEWQYFPNTRRNWYWADIDASDASSATSVRFVFGFLDDSTANALFVRCVRAD